MSIFSTPRGSFPVVIRFRPISSKGAENDPFDTGTIESTTGLKGIWNQTEGTFEISKARENVPVTVDQTHKG